MCLCKYVLVHVACGRKIVAYHIRTVCISTHVHLIIVMQVTGRGEKIRWYNHALPDFTYNKLRLLTKAVRSVYFKALMSKCSLKSRTCICTV